MGLLDQLGSAQAKVPACSCCSHHRSDDASQNQDSQPPKDGCACPSCLCNGAVHVSDEIIIDSHEFSNALFDVVEVKLVATDNTLYQFGSLESLDDATSSGRAMRILHQTFLL